MAVAALRLLGNFELRRLDGQTADLPGQKDRALVAILALSAGTAQSREKLASLLWSDRGDAQARDSLKHALTRIRQCLGEALIADRQTAQLDPAALATDVLRFERLVREGTPDALEQACALCVSDLLDGINIRDPGFEEWLLAERQRLRRLHEDALLKLLAPSLPIATRERAARRLLALDPLREVASRALMHIHGERGETAQAIKLFENLRERLHAELGVKPEPETTRLYEAMRQGHAGVPLIEQGAAQPVSPIEPALPSKPSIAVLPFKNLSNDPEHEFFADGLTEDLITDISRNAGLFVIASNSSFAYKGQAVDVRTVARNLGVRYILEGSARRAAGRVRINVQLIDAIAGGHIWAERFDRAMEDVFSVQDEVTAKIVEALIGRLATTPNAERKRPANMEAYDLCVRGRALILQSQGAREARLMFERAIALEPDLAEAHRLLALSLAIGWMLGGEPKEPNLERANAAAQKALALQPNDAGVRWVNASLLARQRQWDRAEADYALALKLDPNCADAWAMLSELMVLCGRVSEALVDIRTALRLNPHPPGWYYWMLGQAQYLNRQYEEAVETLRREETYRAPSRRTLAASLVQLGKLEEARHEAAMFLANNSHFTIQHWVETQAFRDKAVCQHFVDGYRKAGLP
ncbi:MAG TPA: BTAD domain-containing putative transcriptional regulator [Dongiaceae bacterium]|jgi:TolB-like protein